MRGRSFRVDSWATRQCCARVNAEFVHDAGGVAMQIKAVRSESFTKQIRCDRCGHISELGDADFQEMVCMT